ICHSPSSPRGKIIFLVSLIFSILLYNYYTSSLVSSLLSTRPPTLKTIKELYESDLKVGMENQPYITTFILLQKNDFYTNLLNRTKIYESGKPNFFTPEEGIAKVKKGGFAYHVLGTTAYPIISRTFEQEEICNLDKLNLIRPSVMGHVLANMSQYSEMFEISSTKIRQSGILQRAQGIWLDKPPPCLSDFVVVSVGKNDLFVVYMILLAGWVLAVAIFLAEVIWYKVSTYLDNI
ncbi:hypothetical protein NQ318_019362, partial [Aromia moschata]